MTGKFTPPSPIDEVRESLENLEKKYKEADEKLKKEIENKIESASSPTQETPTLSQVLAKGNEMDKDIDIADGKNFNNFNSASKEVHTTSYDTDFSKLYFAGAKTILEHSNSYIDTHSKYSKQKIELDKDGIYLISNFRHFGEHGNPDSGGGEITSQLYFNFNGFLLSQENNGQKTEIIKVDSEGIKIKKISQTEYSEPTDEKDYITKKYLDEKISNQGNSFIKKGSSDDKVLLGNGGEKELSALDNSNIQIGGRNLFLKSGVTVSNKQYEIASWIITEDIDLGETVTLTVEGDFAEGCYPLLFASAGDGNLGVLLRGVNVWDNAAKRKISKGQSMHLYIIGNGNSDKLNTIRKIKLERGNKSTDWTPAPEDLALYDDILRAGVECTQDTTLQKEHQNQTLFVTVPCNIELNTIDDLSSVSFRKVFDSGVISFSCNGKNIIYTTNNQFNGKKGSTAVISRYGNDCYIDIRNI